MTSSPPQHWEQIWADADPTKVGWFQPHTDISLRLLETYGFIKPQVKMVDMGGGMSRLHTELAGRTGVDVEVVDIAAAAMARAREQVGDVSNISFTVCDAREYTAAQPLDVWHDRAVFHFLREDGEQEAYLQALDRSLAADGTAIIATFAADGWEYCSGLPVQRYDPADLEARLHGFVLVHSEFEDHVRPDEKAQRFQYSVLRRC